MSAVTAAAATTALRSWIPSWFLNEASFYIELAHTCTQTHADVKANSWNCGCIEKTLTANSHLHLCNGQVAPCRVSLHCLLTNICLSSIESDESTWIPWFQGSILKQWGEHARLKHDKKPQISISPLTLSLPQQHFRSCFRKPCRELHWFEYEE